MTFEEGTCAAWLHDLGLNERLARVTVAYCCWLSLQLSLTDVRHVVLGGEGAVVGLTVLVAKRVAGEEVIQISEFGAALLPGAKGFHNGDVYRLNASCLPLQLFIQLGQELPEGPWQQVATQIPDILRGSSPNGFASDWAEFKPGKGLTPASLGSYDAIRVYLWAGCSIPPLGTSMQS